MKTTLKWTMMVLSIMGLTTFASCDNDDDKGPETPKLTEVNGSYSGKMTFSVAAPETQMNIASETEGTDVDVKVANDTITFDKFPADALITAVVGEENAPAIIEAVGDIAYKVGFEGAFNTANDSIALTLDPKPLQIKYSAGEGESAMELTVEVTIEAPEKGTYALKQQNLKFKLNATEAKVGGVNMLPGVITLSFDMTKK